MALTPIRVPSMATYSEDTRTIVSDSFVFDTSSIRVQDVMGYRVSPIVLEVSNDPMAYRQSYTLRCTVNGRRLSVAADMPLDTRITSDDRAVHIMLAQLKRELGLAIVNEVYSPSDIDSHLESRPISPHVNRPIPNTTVHPLPVPDAVEDEIEL